MKLRLRYTNRDSVFFYLRGNPVRKNGMRSVPASYCEEVAAIDSLSTHTIFGKARTVEAHHKDEKGCDGSSLAPKKIIGLW